MLSSRFQRVAAGLVAGGSALYMARSFKNQTAMAKSDAPAPAGGLDPTQFKPFEVSEIQKLTHDTKLYRFRLDTPDTPLGITVASCLLTMTPGPDGKPAIRPYTPTTGPEVKGHFDLVIKTYPNGVASGYFDKLKPGDKVNMKGPIVKLPVTPNMKKEIGMIAGGTGITPMYQVIHELLRHPENKTKITLVFCNKTSSDIMLKNELDSLASKHPDTFKIHYVIDKEEPGWKHGVGYLNADVIKANMPKPSDDNLIFVCGPPGMMNVVSGNKKGPTDQGPLVGALADLGYTPRQVFKF
eukprot:comp21968_c0_seq1/m.31703 comp21968_c0_seq1/g.31703  ORF comp21968_c0_seq1/g.31703 comp21968_c0_seq1/m.31703 type:complete len:297 (-) comp21968_c0_seq1:316-1206(-)